MSTDTILFDVNFRPGIDRESTQYASKGGWYNGDKVRFRAGKPENIRGYEKSCLLYTSPSPRDRQKSRMPSSA